MADTFIKDNSGNYMKDSNGIYLRSRPFNQQIIQDGLVFWGAADPNYLTLVNGLVSVAYDLRETNFVSPIYSRMTQSTVSYRPALVNGYIRITDLMNGGLFLTSNVKTMFLVTFGGKPNGTNAVIGLGTTYDIGLGINYSGNAYSYQSSNIPFYQNLTHRTGPVASINPQILISNKFNMTITRLGNLYDNSYAAGYVNIKEWGWYNRTLNEAEIIYNINALNAKHNVF